MKRGNRVFRTLACIGWIWWILGGCWGGPRQSNDGFQEYWSYFELEDDFNSLENQIKNG